MKYAHYKTSNNVASIVFKMIEKEENETIRNRIKKIYATRYFLFLRNTMTFEQFREEVLEKIGVPCSNPRVEKKKVKAMEVEVQVIRKSHRLLGIDPPYKMDPGCKGALGCFHCNFNPFGCGACEHHHQLTFHERAEFNRFIINDCYKCRDLDCRYCFNRAVWSYQEKKKNEKEECYEQEPSNYIGGLDPECYGCHSV